MLWLRLFFSGALERLLKVGSAVLEWLLSDVRHIAIAALAVFGLWHQFWLDPRQNATISERTEQRDAAIDEREETMNAYEQTVANYLAAAAKATRDAEANVARVKVEQAAITQETIDDFEARLAAVRVTADRLRAGAVRTAELDPGSSGKTDLPGPGDAARGVDEAPGDARLSKERSCLPGFVCLTIDEALIATEQAIQLDALIDWNKRQAAVPFVPREDDHAGQ